MQEHPLVLLERYFNHTAFRSKQEDIINEVISGNDVIALLPTGGGKSICFQIPALAKPGICIVVSPLVALMKDQVNNLANKGIKAMALTNGLSQDQLSIQLDNCIYGNYKFLYLSPERLQQELVLARIDKMEVNLIAIDEAHCISQWGNDFRPAYKNIAALRKVKPHVNLIALTASATESVVDDVILELDMIGPKIFKSSFKRDNLAYMVFKTEDKLRKIEAILKKNTQSSIIYVRNRQSTVNIASQLNHLGFKASIYHGGLSNEVKEKEYQSWLNNNTQVMVATNAFGMGIDKPDVKTVIHTQLPESLESYFQEAGRAGRDGKKAFCVVLIQDQDINIVKQQFINRLADPAMVKLVYRKLNSFFKIAYGEVIDTPFEFSFSQFCETYKLKTAVTFEALQTLDRNSVITLSKQFGQKTRVQFIVKNNNLFDYLDKHPKIALITKAILRSYGGIFDNELNIKVETIAKKVGTGVSKINSVLKKLETDEIITLYQNKTDATITFLEPREDDRTINRISKTIKAQNALKKEKVKAVIQYIENEETCKSQLLLSYFGEKDSNPCGVCSTCIQDKIETIQNTENICSIANLITECLKTGELSSRALQDKLKMSDNTIIKGIEYLLDQQQITITQANTYILK